MKLLYDDKCWTHPEMQKRGAPVVIGGNYGLAFNPKRTDANDFLHLVEHYGLTSVKLCAVTAIRARAMDRADEIGHAKEAFLSDLLLIAGNSLKGKNILTDAGKFRAITNDGKFHQRRDPNRLKPKEPLA